MRPTLQPLPEPYCNPQLVRYCQPGLSCLCFCTNTLMCCCCMPFLVLGTFTFHINVQESITHLSRHRTVWSLAGSTARARSGACGFGVIVTHPGFWKEIDSQNKPITQLPSIQASLSCRSRGLHIVQERHSEPPAVAACPLRSYIDLHNVCLRSVPTMTCLQTGVITIEAGLHQPRSCSCIPLHGASSAAHRYQPMCRSLSPVCQAAGCRLQRM